MQRDRRAQGDLRRGGRRVQRHLRAGRQPAAPLQDPAGTARAPGLRLSGHDDNVDSFLLRQVSFFSTSPELSNKARFEYFTRTIPSDLHQVRAMVEIVKKLGWRYVSIIYEESNYGIKASHLL